MNMFAPATRKKLKARIALDGPAGSGKTYTGLRFAFALAGQGGRVAVIDTEHRSASKYQGEAPDKVPWDFDVCELEHYAPSTYAQVIKSAGAEGYDVVLVDSLSHAWEGVGGALDQVDKKGGNSFTAWKDVTPQHRDMVDAILACPCHVIVTMRTKMEYVLEEQTNKKGRSVQVPKKVGMAPIQRAGMEYEFDVVCDLDIVHSITISKTRCPALDGQRAVNPGPAFVAPLLSWLDVGTEDVGGVGTDAETEAKQQPTPEAKPDKPKPAAKRKPKPDPQRKPKLTKLDGKQKVDEHHARANDPCGEAVADQIKAAAKDAGLPPSKLFEILHRHGVEKVVELPDLAAQKLLARLVARATEEQVPF